MFAQIEMSSDEFVIIERRARALGYETVSEYLLSLAHEDIADANVDDGRTKEEILHGIQQSMRQALRGEGRSAREVLQELDNGD
jgi:hypothetical protein